MILVSGATGFLGAHMVCYLLQQGLTVKALRRGNSSLDEFNYIASIYFVSEFPDHLLTWAQADVMDMPSLEQHMQDIHEVYHCAAIVSFRQKDKALMTRVNVEGTANMVNAALLANVKKFCHVSSIAAIGRDKQGTTVSENTRWGQSRHNSNYAISKYKAELQAWRGAEEGLNMVIVNPGVIIGPSLWHRGTGKLFSMVWNNLPFYTHGINGYVDVRDVCKAMHQLMQHNKFGQRYILVGHNMENKYFMHTCAKLMNKRAASIEVDTFIAELAWIGSALLRLLGKETGITKETARASLNVYFYNTQKIESNIGFRFTPVNETLSYICQHFLASKTTS